MKITVTTPPPVEKPPRVVTIELTPREAEKLRYDLSYHKAIVGQCDIRVAPLEDETMTLFLALNKLDLE
jgi:hypothetical protein